MKFLKKLFSPRFLCILLLIVEILVLIGAWWFLEYGLDSILEGQTAKNGMSLANLIAILAFVGVRIVLTVIAIIVFFRIINRDENPEYKIPWVAFMFIVPIITLSFYVIFVRVRLSKRQYRIIKPVRKILDAKKEEWKPEHEANLAEIEPHFQGTFQYLHNVTRFSVSKNNHLTYYKNGEEFFPAMVEELKKAKRFIFMEFFIVTDGKWWKAIHEVLKQKAAEGVEVRFVYDDFGSGAGLPDKFIKTLRSEGIHVYPFHPISFLLNRTINNRDHRKIVVVDHQCAFTGGMNLADEYANDKLRFGYWKDTMVKIEGRGIRDLAGIFLENYDLASESVSDYSAFLDGDDYPHFEEPGYCFSFGDGPGPYTKHEQIGEQNYINLLSTATKQADICTPYLICSYPLQRAVLAAAKRGVRVNLIVPGIPDKKMVYKMAQCQFGIFLKAGVHIYVYTPGFNHEKQMLIDDRICFCGTINFDFRSLTHHFEDGMVFLDTPCMKEVRADFDEMMSQSQEVPVDFKVPTGQRLICALLKIFRVLL